MVLLAIQLMHHRQSPPASNCVHCIGVITSFLLKQTGWARKQRASRAPESALEPIHFFSKPPRAAKFDRGFEECPPRVCPLKTFNEKRCALWEIGRDR